MPGEPPIMQIPANEIPNGIHCITAGGTCWRRFGGAAATSRYAPPAMIGQIIKSHFGTPLENGKMIFGAVMIGTTIDASSATPAKNRTFRCRLGSRSIDTG